MFNSIATTTMRIHNFVVMFDLAKTNIDDEVELKIAAGLTENQAYSALVGGHSTRCIIFTFAELMAALEKQLKALDAFDDATKVQFNDFIRDSRAHFEAQDAKLNRAIALNKTPGQIQHAIAIVHARLEVDRLEGRVDAKIGMADQSVTARKFGINTTAITKDFIMTDEMRAAFEADGRFDLTFHKAWNDPGQMTSHPASWTISLKG